MVSSGVSSSSSSNAAARNRSRQAPAWVRAGFWLCILIALAAAGRRFVVILRPTAAPTPQMQALDSYFSSHAALTLAHIIPATLFVLVTPFVFLERFRKSRWPERLLFPLGFVVAGTAYAMSTDSVGGWTERSAVLFFNTLFLVSLARALALARRGAAEEERRWLTRAVGILLGIATTRPVMGVFFATSRLTHLEPRQFFGIAFWIGFSINTLAVELWLRSRSTEARI